jgi:hypothetical protein
VQVVRVRLNLPDVTVPFLSRVVTALTLVGLVVVVGIWPAPDMAQAAVGTNKVLNFQGRLLTATGAVIADGNYNMQFKSGRRNGWGPIPRLSPLKMAISQLIWVA